MEFAAVIHRPDSEMAYFKNDVFQIRLKAKRDDLKKVALIYGDPYSLISENLDPFYQHPQPMDKILQDQYYDYWELEVQLPTKRLAYAFVLVDNDDEAYYYNDQGFWPVDHDASLDNANSYFRLPYGHEIDAIHVPSWVAGTVWYQIFPERFANGDPTNDPAGTKSWNSQDHPSRTAYYGGDLQGIIDHLDDLANLGVTGLYFNPLFLAPSKHKYDTIDYFQIDPHFGTNQLFGELVQAAHQRGMRVMLDAVFNHLGINSPQWQDVIRYGQQSTYADWFHIHEFPVTYQATSNPEYSPAISYETFANNPQMPKLNTTNPEVQAYLLSIATYWVKEYDIDAWRLDVANEIDHHFWRAFHQRVLALKPDFYILGEIWHRAQAWLNGDQFSGVMNYPYTGLIIDGIIKRQLSLNQLSAGLSRQLMLYRDQTNMLMFNTLDSHDTARLMTMATGNYRLVELAIAFLILQPGMPSLYYGTKIGIAGNNDPDCRNPMNWQPDAKGRHLAQQIKKLIAFRHRYGALLTAGKIKFVVVDPDRIQVVRFNDHQQVIGDFDLGSNSYQLQVK